MQGIEYMFSQFNKLRSTIPVGLVDDGVEDSYNLPCWARDDGSKGNPDGASDPSYLSINITLISTPKVLQVMYAFSKMI